MKTIGYRLLAAVCMLCLAVLVCSPFSVRAEEHTGTLALWCVKDTEVVSGMHWQIFRVGHREENDYCFEGDFSGYRPTLGNRSVSMLEWDAQTVASAAETLRVNALIDKLPNCGEGYTDARGNLNFTGLEDGLYLVIGDTLKRGTKTYIPSAIFFEMNGQEEAYLNSFPKIILETLDEHTDSYSVRKIWANQLNQPPDTGVYITCELYCDGELAETVRLDESNGWLYTWSDKSGHEWLVREKEIPNNYSVSYTRNHTQYIIVNTYDEEYDDSSTTDVNTTTAATTTTDGQMTDRQSTSSLETTATSQDTTTAGSSAASDTVITTSQTVTTVVTTASEGGDDLPQTGQLWWPVPILSGSGLLLLLAEICLRKKDDGT